MTMHKRASLLQDQTAVLSQDCDRVRRSATYVAESSDGAMLDSLNQLAYSQNVMETSRQLVARLRSSDGHK